MVVTVVIHITAQVFHTEYVLSNTCYLIDKWPG